MIAVQTNEMMCCCPMQATMCAGLVQCTFFEFGRVNAIKV